VCIIPIKCACDYKPRLILHHKENTGLREIMDTPDRFTAKIK